MVMEPIPAIGRRFLCARRITRLETGTYFVKHSRNGTMCIVAPLSRTKYKIPFLKTIFVGKRVPIDDVSYVGADAITRSEGLVSGGRRGNVTGFCNCTGRAWMTFCCG